MSRKDRHRRQVALLIESSRKYGRELLRGIAFFAHTNSDWSLLHQEMTIDDPLPGWLNKEEVHGAIARVDYHNVGTIRELGIPCVDVLCRYQFEGIPQVETDDRLVSELAFEHLWERGFRRFAFCGYQHAHYSEARLGFFRKLVADMNCPLSIYETPGDRESPLSIVEESGMVDVNSTFEWLSQLTPPTGLFVCNDIRGQQVLNSCRQLGFTVPDDISVIGVDDDDAICRLSAPPLSSVRPDAETIGYRAAEILEAMMVGEAAPAGTVYVPPEGVVQRLSTQVAAVEDPEVARVHRFIREHACDGITVHDLTKITSLSRRQLERRFRRHLHRTLKEEITATQIDRVKQLLKETNMPLEQIVRSTGYQHPETLSAVFKREVGITPGRYRQQVKTRESR